MTEHKSHAEHITSRELSPQEKRAFGDAWMKVVIGADASAPEKVGGMTNNEFQRFLTETLKTGADALIEEWGLEPDESAVQQIKQEADSEKRTELERTYLQTMHDRVRAFVQSWKKGGDISNKWDSWPSSMHENGRFNCVGASLIGARILERAGISHVIGGPYQHAVNVARLANGEYWYADFMNAPNQLKKIRPEKKRIAGQPVMRFEEPGICYRLLPIYKSDDASLFVLGNLRGLIHDAQDPSVPQDAEKRAADYFFAQHREPLELINRLSEKADVEKNTNYFDSPQYLREEERVNRLDAISERVKKSVDVSPDANTFSRLRSEVKKQAETVRDYFLQKERERAPDIFSPTLRSILTAYRAELATLQQNDPEEYRMFVENLIANFTSG